MEDNNLIRVVPLKDNVIRAKVTEALFKKVMAVASQNDSNMSEVVRLCVEFALPEVDKALRGLKSGKKVTY